MSSSELQPRDHQLLAALESCFGSTAFLQYDFVWKDIDARLELPILQGDEDSLRRLASAGRIKHLGARNGRICFTVSKKT